VRTVARLLAVRGGARSRPRPGGAAGKKDVDITAVEPVGNYAVRLVFSDGHDTGLYSWDYLYGMGVDKERLWKEYLGRMAKEGASREAVPAAAPPQTKPGWKKL